MSFSPSPVFQAALPERNAVSVRSDAAAKLFESVTTLRCVGGSDPRCSESHLDPVTLRERLRHDVCARGGARGSVSPRSAAQRARRTRSVTAGAGSG